MNAEEREKRNTEIREAKNSGMPIPDIATKFELTVPRIYQILAETENKTPKLADVISQLPPITKNENFNVIEQSESSSYIPFKVRLLLKTGKLSSAFYSSNESNFAKTVRFFDEYKPSMKFNSEKEYEQDIVRALQISFGKENINPQANIEGGKIDIEVFKSTGIEIKLPLSMADLDRLFGQATIRYLPKYKGDSINRLIIVIFVHDLKAFDAISHANTLMEHGITVFLYSWKRVLVE